nr:TPM domain-containing protein [Flavobacterium sp.]
MSKVEDFLTKEEEQEIVEAIRMAEKNTSGEIRVHLEKTTPMDAYDRAMEVFHELKMDETELQNGVLIYL